MASNEIECTRFEQSSVIKFYVAEKCKLCEIYSRMCDVYEKGSFSKKMFTNSLNVDLRQQTLVKKIAQEVEIHWLSGKENIPGAVISKESEIVRFHLF